MSGRGSRPLHQLYTPRARPWSSTSHRAPVCCSASALAVYTVPAPVIEYVKPGPAKTPRPAPVHRTSASSAHLYCTSGGTQLRHHSRWNCPRSDCHGPRAAWRKRSGRLVHTSEMRLIGPRLSLEDRSGRLGRGFGLVLSGGRFFRGAKTSPFYVHVEFARTSLLAFPFSDSVHFVFQNISL